MRRIAFVHDWLVSYAGSERVLEQMLNVFPEADLFATVADPLETRKFLGDRPIRTSFIQKLPYARSRHRMYLPLMPFAVEQLDVSAYDVVVSSSHAVAKGVLTGPDQLHLCMCYSPMRYAWDLQHQYLTESNLASGLKGFVARLMLHYLRIWDVRSAAGVDRFIAISDFIARRIRKCYRRDSVVIHPPVDVDAFTIGERKEDFYLTASRFVPYKRIDLIVRAFAGMPTRRLIVIGDGPDRAKIEKAAAGHANITLLGYQPHAVLRDHLQRARAFVFAAEEDFGIAPVEAQACGTPVVAFGRGGSLETVKDGVTGVFFLDQTTASLIDAIARFEGLRRFPAAACRAHAEGFSISRFRDEFAALVEREWRSFSNSRSHPAGAEEAPPGPPVPLDERTRA
ncbi:MAG: glycosyltransferase family 4 protein [Planctomycetes bacterium]|nr:glycosyltransferase family 4 protein [Planctomycetota bacterium]